MAGAIWVLAETTPDGSLARISREAATAGRMLAADAAREVAGIVVTAEPAAVAAELARYLPRVVAIRAPAAADRPVAGVAGPLIAALAAAERPAYLLAGATAEGRDLAGTLAALIDLGVLANASAIAWTGGEGGAPAGPLVEMSVLGGRAITTSRFTAGRGIVLLRPGAVVGEPLPAPGIVVAGDVAPAAELPAVMIVERVAASATAAPIEEAKIVVTGGRGVAGEAGVALVGELAAALGGVVGATRAAVDAGWIPYASQIGQTGKTVRPILYVGLGVSGAIQHRVGMQGAETIVAVNRDPEAPIAEFADLLVVGDLFEVVPPLVAALRARNG